jgi:hypothetical protein
MTFQNDRATQYDGIESDHLQGPYAAQYLCQIREIAMIAHEQSNPAAAKKHRLKLAITIFCVELVAVALLWAGYGVTLSLGVAIGGGVAVLIWPWLVRSVRRTAGKLRSVAIAVGSRVLDRRNNQFGIRSLLLAALLIALVCAWFGYRERQITLERRRLDGRWEMVGANGKPYVLSGGKPIIVEFARESYAVDPFQEPKWLDFYGPQGTSEAIYRWEDDEIVVMQVSAGYERPNSFDFQSLKLKRKAAAALPGGAKSVAVEVSTSTYRLRRARDE